MPKNSDKKPTTKKTSTPKRPADKLRWTGDDWTTLTPKEEQAWFLGFWRK